MAISRVTARDTETDIEALSRVAAARDTSLAQSNRFLLVGIGSAVLYSVKLAGLRIDVVVADTRIFETPYGLFVFGIIGAVSFILAQLRYLDGKALDLQLKELCVKDGVIGVSYGTFPSPHHWLLPAERRFAGERASFLARFAFTVLGLLTLLIYLVPLFAAFHFLVSWPSLAGENYTDMQWWLVFIALVAAGMSYILAQGVYSEN